MHQLSDSIQNIKGVGFANGKKLEKLKIQTVKDLLWHIPYRYDDFSHTIKISEIKADKMAIVKGKVISINTTRTYRRRMFITSALLQDSTGNIKLVWFNQPYLTTIIKKGKIVLIAGKAVYDKNGLYINTPQYQLISHNSKLKTIKF
jgi:ATP-dependent DNA helicase RecG